MHSIIGIRREDLDKKGEKRVAITPEHVHEIIQAGHTLWVQAGIHPKTKEEKRAFADREYLEKGAQIREDLNSASVIFGLKEIKSDLILPQKTYLLFSHTHKGQVKNRAMLQKLSEMKCTLIDYELITNQKRQRLITAFTFFAGYAGMIDSLWTLGKRLTVKGIDNPYSSITQSVETGDLNEMKKRVHQLGIHIKQTGTPANLPPLICCFMGNGKTSAGAQEIFDLLPHQQISIDELKQVFEAGSRNQVYKLVLDIPELYRLKAESEYRKKPFSDREIFDLYLKKPEHFESNLDQVFPYCTILMNCILWSPEYPRLLSRDFTQKHWTENHPIEVIGDITCDPEGAIQFSKETWIDNPVFVYNPDSRQSKDGFEGDGIAVMAVTNLPCEFPADASRQFSQDLSPFLQGIVNANYEAESVQLSDLPPEIQGATILWKGNFTEKFSYMGAYI